MALLKSDSTTLQKGDQAPAFSLKNVDNSIGSLSDFKGKIVVVIFMCNHCPYVIPKMDEIAAIQDEYTDRGVAVICISSNDPEIVPDDSFENMQSLAEEKGYAYYLFDETQGVAKAYGAVCTPDPFVFDTNHQLVYHGRITDDLGTTNNPTEHTLRRVLDTLLSGKPVDPWFIPSQGCSIKWK